jgi:hypothetical protein
VLLVIKCVIGGILVTDFNKVWGEGGQKMVSRASADYLAVGGKQKIYFRSRLVRASAIAARVYWSAWQRDVYHIS